MCVCVCVCVCVHVSRGRVQAFGVPYLFFLSPGVGISDLVEGNRIHHEWPGFASNSHHTSR